MSAAMSWFVSVMLTLGLVLAMHHLGVDLTSALSSALRETEHFLNLPLLFL
jgi:hypothetical protein